MEQIFGTDNCYNQDEGRGHEKLFVAFGLYWLPDHLDIGVSTKYHFTSFPLLTSVHSAYALPWKKF